MALIVNQVERYQSEIYQSIDLIEYYKRCIVRNEQGRGKQTREGAKVNFEHFISF
jgi:hypothetical protein